jgi:hypothetical protein
VIMFSFFLCVSDASRSAIIGRAGVAGSALVAVSSDAPSSLILLATECDNAFVVSVSVRVSDGDARVTQRATLPRHDWSEPVESKPVRCMFCMQKITDGVCFCVGELQCDSETCADSECRSVQHSRTCRMRQTGAQSVH